MFIVYFCCVGVCGDRLGRRASPGGRFAESGRVRHIVRSTAGIVWNVSVIVVDVQVGDAVVSGGF